MRLGFQDFAGSTVVHSTGGWAALAGVLVVGARRGKFRADGSVLPTPPSNVPEVTLGVFIIWLGFVGFNGGSWLALGWGAGCRRRSASSSRTPISPARRAPWRPCCCRVPLLGRTDLRAVLNGVISGLVSVAAGPDLLDQGWAIFIGAVGRRRVHPPECALLEMLRIDDEVGAIPAHLGGGVWGTLAVCIAGGGSLPVQALGVVAVGVFVFGVSLVAWLLIDAVLGARIAPRVEELGQDATELGIESFPEFILADDPLLVDDAVADDPEPRE